MPGRARVADGALWIEARAGGARGLAGFEVSRDGTPLPFQAVAAATELEPAAARLRLRLPPPAGPALYEVRALARSGLTSEPRFLEYRPVY